MTEAVFSQALDEIYGVFAKAVPKGNIRSVLWDRVREIPDVAVPGIVDRICDLERLPGNMAREFRAGWADWRSAHPEKIVRQTCHACGSVGVRYCWVRNPASGNWHGFVASCPVCDPAAPSLRELERRGVVIMPVDYPGGVLRFAADRGFAGPVAEVSDLQGDVRSGGGRSAIMGCVGADQRQDARRMAHLPAMERDAHAAAAERF